MTIAPALYELDYDPNTGRGRGAEAEMLTVNAGIRPALERAKKAVAEGKPALVCVVTDHNARDHSGFHQLLDLNEWPTRSFMTNATFATRKSRKRRNSLAKWRSNRN